ncbi:hypothetical protein [Microbacterium schleiferi]|uniref:hypothetical protein n=1 Tax=Microbacterium schleiferi TaxID=69362 RepID=UPI00311F186F
MSSAPSRSDDPVGQVLTDATDVLRDDILACAAPAPVILIDGRSGAGKTSLTRLLLDRWPLDGTPQLLALDSTYPGWDGLDAAVEDVTRNVLIPHAAGQQGRWRRWDWSAGEYAESHGVDPGLPLVVEGSGILTPATAVLAGVRVWVESPADSRRERALERDGDTYRPHWERWARQEDDHIARDDPAAHATRVFVVP